MTKAKTPPSGQTSHVLGAEDEAEIEQHTITPAHGLPLYAKAPNERRPS
jgi:hypothetical protein